MRKESEMKHNKAGGEKGDCVLGSCPRGDGVWPLAKLCGDRRTKRITVNRVRICFENKKTLFGEKKDI
jgi:hypothetical protein